MCGFQSSEHDSPLPPDEIIRLKNVTLPFPDAYANKGYNKAGHDLTLKFQLSFIKIIIAAERKINVLNPDLNVQCFSTTVLPFYSRNFPIALIISESNT